MACAGKVTMRKIRQEDLNSPKKRTTKFAKIFVVVLLLVFFLEIWVVSRSSTYGSKIQEIKDAKASLVLENQELENIVAHQTSLGLVEKKAVEYGFENIKQLEYISPPVVASAR